MYLDIYIQKVGVAAGAGAVLQQGHRWQVCPAGVKGGDDDDRVMMMMMMMMMMSRSIQWECKAEMDNSLRFGQVEVVCEG